MTSFRSEPSVAFILDHDLKPYRVPFFERLQKAGFKITIMHCGDFLEVGSGIKQEIVESIRLRYFEYRRLPSLSGFDIVVHMQNIRILNLWLMAFNPFKSFKLISWGIGVSSSKGINKQSRYIVIVRNLIAILGTCQVLYSEYPLRFFSKRVLQKTFIAPNTVDSPYQFDFSEFQKDHFLFIGALNKRKGLYDLLSAFKEFLISVESPRIKKLIIIGDGPERATIERFIERNRLVESIELVGDMSDDRIKSTYFKNAVACISPMQAGLSVLESFSYGVPFICYEDAISGGEHLNIENDVNGFLVRDETQLLDAMCRLDREVSYSENLGKSAFTLYNHARTIDHMVKGFTDAFEYALH